MTEFTISFSNMTEILMFITFQAEKVREAAWECDWVGAPTSFQKCIISILDNGNQEFVISAEGFINISNSTLLKVLKLYSGGNKM